MLETFDLSDIFTELQNYLCAPPAAAPVFPGRCLTNIMNLIPEGEYNENWGSMRTTHRYCINTAPVTYIYPTNDSVRRILNDLQIVKVGARPLPARLGCGDVAVQCHGRGMLWE